MSVSFYVDIPDHFEDYTEECFVCLGDCYETYIVIDEDFVGPMLQRFEEDGSPALDFDDNIMLQSPLKVAAFKCGMCLGVGVNVRARSRYATANFANGNAAALLALIGLVSPYGTGDVKACEVAGKIRLMIRRLNGDVSGATSESFEYGGPGTGHCRVIECGRDEDYIMRGLQSLLAVFIDAQKNNAGVYWA